jgi:Ni/Fe-hydrogenase b-type cytochrome subunit
MGDAAFAPGVQLSRTNVVDKPRHSPLVRVTHWITALSFVGLLVSGIGILLSHPRFYWGETGGVGTPSLFDLPLPFMLGGPSGWGRYLHFQSAWVFIPNLLVYVAWGLVGRHFQKDVVPAKGTLNWRQVRRYLLLARPSAGEERTYNVLQRISYLSVVFFLFPLLIWTGLAMSPALTSVFRWLVDVLGGHQTARTLHFFVSIALVLFVFVHVAMVWRAGFRRRVGAMITGRAGPAKEDT